MLLVRALPMAEDVSSELTPQVRFVDCGDNFEAVRCPRCGVDLGEWWTLAMEAANEQQFRKLMVTTPCCRSRLSLNDLSYSWQMGFARFKLTVLNPGLTQLPNSITQGLEAVLKCRLRVIWAHY